MDNKAILYFEAPSTSDALTWFRGNVSESIGEELRSQGPSCSDQSAYTRVEGVTVLYLNPLIHRLNSRLCANNMHSLAVRSLSVLVSLCLLLRYPRLLASTLSFTVSQHHPRVLCPLLR